MSNIHHKFVSEQILHSRPRQTNMGVLDGVKNWDRDTHKKIQYKAE